MVSFIFSGVSRVGMASYKAQEVAGLSDCNTAAMGNVHYILGLPGLICGGSN